MNGEPSGINAVTLVGGGQVALLAATALKRALPNLAVTLIQVPVHPAAFADHAHVTLPSLAVLHARVGITERSMLERASASHWLATRYVPTHSAGAQFFVGHGAVLAPLVGLAAPEVPHPGNAGISAVTSALAQAGHFALPSDDPQSPLSDIDYALRFDPKVHVDGLRALARHLQVPVVEASGIAVEREVSGQVRCIWAGGTRVAADIVIDCSGPARLVCGNSGWHSWLDQVALDCCAPIDDESQPSASPLEEIAGLPNGLWLLSHGRDRTRRLRCWSSVASAGVPRGTAYSATFAEAIKLTPGYLDLAWSGNVIAIGDCAATWAPVGWINLHIAVLTIERMIELWPRDTHWAPEQNEFNRRVRLMTDRTADFIALHLAMTQLEPTVSPSLASLIAEYQRRGRVLPAEDDPISRDLWLQLLAGLYPKAQLSPHMLAFSPDEWEIRRQVARARITTAVKAGKPYSTVLRNIMENQQ